LGDLRALSDKDKEDVKYVMEHMQNVDYFALSFVRQPEDIIELRNLIRSIGEEKNISTYFYPRIIAKIERPECFQNMKTTESMEMYVIVILIVFLTMIISMSINLFLLPLFSPENQITL
jgi:pyruvate kinase